MTEKTAASKTPATPVNVPFDVEDWLLDANLPHASVDVYKAGLLPAEAATLQRMIETERNLEDFERTAADENRFVALERRYMRVLESWASSRITVYISALPPEKIREMREAHEAKTEGMDPTVANELFGYELLAEAIIGVAENGVDYTNEDGTPALFGPVSWQPRHIRGLANKLGGAQMTLLVRARQDAQNALPQVDADFLQRLSGESNENTNR